MLGFFSYKIVICRFFFNSFSKTSFINTIIVSKSLDLDILGNRSVIHSVPTGLPTAVGTEWITHGICSGYGMDHTWVTEDEILIRSSIFRPGLGPNCLHRVSAEDNGRQRGNNNLAPGESMRGSRGWRRQGVRTFLGKSQSYRVP